MRVLMISHLYPSRADEVYGSFVHSQVRALQDLGCSVQVVAPTPWVPLPLAWVKGQWRRWRAAPKSDRLDGVDVLYPRILRTPGALCFARAGRHYLQVLKGLVGALHRRFPFDLVHAQVGYPDGWAAARLLPHLPHVLTLHGQELQKIVHWSQTLKTMVEETIQGAGAIVVASEKMRRLAVQHGVHPDKVRLVPNGVDPLPPAALPDWLRRRIAGKKVLLSVSRLEPEKGLDTNIRALDLLRARHPDLVYVVVGDGSQTRSLKKLARALGLENRVIFAGCQPRSKVGAFYACGHVFSLPSRGEAFGIAYLEAMAAGLPVIASRGEGIAPLLRRGGGLLVKHGDSLELAQAIARLLDPALAVKLGQEGRQLAREFSWQKSARELLKVYEELLA
ncbi:MAG TPA: glycosyltransferase [Bacillota bacterium]|nr:glycosyltransferase [Bacillota bacterium]HQE01292.1 glycosyltransferase [Bacillota bacterium]